jgi:hypothetical protein
VITLEQLEALRAALPDDDALPASTTKAALDAHQQRRRELDRRLLAARNAMQTLAALADPDPLWAERLNAWRQTLCAELLALPPRIRDAKLLGVQRNLTLSIRVLDFGPDHALKDCEYSLGSLRIGELMREAGYEAQGADPDRNFTGVMPWFGSLKEIEHRAKDVERRRFAAQSALDDALLDDDEREKKGAEAKARRAALDALPTRKVRGDGSQFDKYPDGRIVEIEAL